MSLIRYNCFSYYVRINIYITNIDSYPNLLNNLKEILYKNYKILSIKTYNEIPNTYYHFITSVNIFHTNVLFRQLVNLIEHIYVSISCLTMKEYKKEIKKYFITN